MHIPHRPEAAAAILLAGMALLHGVLGGSGGASLLRTAEAPSLPAPGSRAGQTLEWCRSNVTIIHDVYWASACSVVAEEQRRLHPDAAAPDGSPDCTLPDERARLLNAARANAEEQCVQEAVAMAR